MGVLVVASDAVPMIAGELPYSAKPVYGVTLFWVHVAPAGVLATLVEESERLSVRVTFTGDDMALLPMGVRHWRYYVWQRDFYGGDGPLPSPAREHPLAFLRWSLVTRRVVLPPSEATLRMLGYTGER